MGDVVTDLIPRAYQARPIRDGGVANEVTWIAVCPVDGCQYGVQLDNLQVAADAVAGHAARAHDTDAHRLNGEPPLSLITRAVDELEAGRTAEALGMIREARDRMQHWVVE